MAGYDTSAMGSFSPTLVDPFAGSPRVSPGVLGSPPEPASSGLSMPGGAGTWLQIGGALGNTVATLVEGTADMKRYQRAAQVAKEVDTQQALMRMVAYLQDQQAMSSALKDSGAAKAFDPDATGASEIKASSAPLSDASRDIVGGTMGLLAQKGLENRGDTAAVGRQMNRGSQRAMEPLRDFFTEAADRRPAAQTAMGMINRAGQARVNEALADVGPEQAFADLLRMGGQVAGTTGLLL